MAIVVMEAMDLPLCMCLRLTMAMATAPPNTPMATTSMAMARGTLRLSPDMAMAAEATPTDLPRDSLDTMVATDMVGMDMAVMARGMLRLSPDMAMAAEATPTDLPRDSLDTMVATDMVAMDMAVMERGTQRLSPDMAMALLPTIPMVAPALSTGAPRV